MSAIYHGSGSGLSWLPSRPEFSFFEQRVAEEQLVIKIFIELGDGWWGYRFQDCEFYAPGWKSGYTDADVAATPRMCQS